MFQSDLSKAAGAQGTVLGCQQVAAEHHVLGGFGGAGTSSTRGRDAPVHGNHDTRDPNLRFVDLTGDGHADVLISETQVFIWHLSLAEAGFGRPWRSMRESMSR